MLIISPDGNILFANRTMTEIVGYTRKEMEGSCCTLLGCDACQILQTESQDPWRSLFIHKQIRNKRCMLTRKNGTYVATLKNASLIKNRRGKGVAALEIFDDVTELDKKERTILELTCALNDTGGFCGMVGESRAMKNVHHLIKKAAHIDANILISGKSGTGKELVANALHETGKRKSGPFVKINCAALSETLIESQIFGHVKGAFTGAHQHRKGLFEVADGGDIFLDEIGEISLRTQTKLLRVVETKQLERVGGTSPISVDVRIIAATNQELNTRVSEGRFRQDLFYRLNVFPIHLPPLQDRKEDIPLLAISMLNEFRRQFGKDTLQISSDLMNFFMQYDWPGNVRELRNALEYASILSDSSLLEVRNLPNNLRLLFDRMMKSAADPGGSPADKDEKLRLLEALQVAGGNQSRAAEILGVHRMTVWNRLRKYGISAKKNFEL